MRVSRALTRTGEGFVIGWLVSVVSPHPNREEPPMSEPNDYPYPDEDEVADEVFMDPGNFDGDYGPGSYYAHAMSKDD